MQIGLVIKVLTADGIRMQRPVPRWRSPPRAKRSAKKLSNPTPQPKPTAL
jgi:hypothetical protein